MSDRVREVFLPPNQMISDVLPPHTVIPELAKAVRGAALQEPDKFEMRPDAAEEEDVEPIGYKAVGQHPPPGAVQDAHRLRHDLAREPVPMKDPPAVSHTEVDTSDHRLLTTRQLFVFWGK